MASAPPALEPIVKLWEQSFGNAEGCESVCRLGQALPGIAASLPEASTDNADVVPVIVTDVLDGASASTVQTTLGRLVAKLLPQIIWLRAEPADEALRNQLLALGFVSAGAFHGRFAYAYDLAMANQPREWNSPEHWANPDQFHKRW